MKKITLSPFRKRKLITIVCASPILLFLMAQSWTLLLTTFAILLAHILFLLFGTDENFSSTNQHQKPFKNSVHSPQGKVNDPTFNGLGTLHSRQRDLGF